jgi:hypothetical protein
MSTARVNHLDLLAPPVTQTVQQRSFVIGAIFSVIGIIGAFVAPDAFFRSYLLAYMLWLGLTLGCMGFLMIQHLTGGGWGTVMRRLLEAGTRNIGMMIVLFIPIIVGMKRIYVWTNPDFLGKEQHLRDLAQQYLNPSFFTIRAVIYFIIWFAMIFFLNRWSAQQDSAPVKDIRAMRKLSAPGLVIYAFSISFAVIDWVMSLTPPWISTIYALIFIVGQCLSALCFMIVVETILRKYQPISEVLVPKDLHNQGKLILAFVMLWAYFSFSQLLIIWAGNLPDEITFYTRRFQGGWQYLGLFLVTFHFAVPFCLLLSRPLKRNTQRLVKVAALLIFMRYVDLFWFIQPTANQSFYFHWLDLVVPVAMGALWMGMFFRNLRGRPLLPAYDPRTQLLLETAHD